MELPQFDVVSHHEIEIAATPERTWAALQEGDLAGSAISKVLLALRGYGLRARRVRAGGTIAERLQRFGFTKLVEVPGEELVFGLAGRFWRFDGGLERLSGPDDFRTFAKDGCVKAAWNSARRRDRSGAVAADHGDARPVPWRRRPPQVPVLLGRRWTIFRSDPDGLLRGVRRSAEG